MVALIATKPTNTIALKPIVHGKISPRSTLPRKLGLGPCSFKKVPPLRYNLAGNWISLAFGCKHPIIVNGLCSHCNQLMPEDFGMAFDYIMEGLRMSLDEIARLKVISSEKVFGQKKLHLVLDFDHTLLHSKAIKKLTTNELYLLEQMDSNTSKGSLFVFEDQYLVKLRPFVRSFLEEASSMFEINVCSMGTRQYVKKVAEFLDPEGKYFGTRLITREDFGQRKEKNLNLVLGLECGTVIVDDNESVWSNYLDNLITIDRYNYFTVRDFEGKSYAEMKTDESESEGELANVLGHLRGIRSLFFDNA